MFWLQSIQEHVLPAFFLKNLLTESARFSKI